MNWIKKSFANFLVGNNAWILFVVLVLISFNWVLTFIMYNSSYVYFEMSKWILFAQFLVGVTLLFAPVLLFCLCRKWIKDKCAKYGYWVIWLAVFIVYPTVCFGWLEWSRYVIPVKMQPEVMWIIAVFLVPIEIVTAPSFTMNINVNWQQWKSYVTPERLAIGIFVALTLQSTFVQRFNSFVNLEEFELFSALIQNIVVYAFIYLFYRINHYFLVNKIYRQKGLIYYAFAFVAFAMLFYLPFLALNFCLPAFNSLFQYKLGAEYWVGDNPPVAFWSIYKGAGMTGAIFTIPIIILVQWYKQSITISKLEKEKSETELNLLKQQINPHFFFNTLNNVYSMSLTQDPRTSEGILQLSDLMRYVIYKGQQSSVSLCEEVKYVEDFLELQKMRLHQSFDLKFDKVIQNENAHITPLLFIILVENAFKLGIESAENNSFLHMHLMQKEDQLVFTCINSVEDEVSDQKHGLGLHNLKRRLQLIYPDRHTLILGKRENSYFASLSIQLIREI